MLKNILNTNKVTVLQKSQQKNINGGGGLNSFCHNDSECDRGLVCAGCLCRPIGGPV